MKRKDGFILRTVCGETILAGEGLDAINFNKLIGLNETAVWLWNKAGEQGEFTVDSLTEALTQTYEVDLKTARTDVEKQLTQWKELGIIL